MSTDCRRTSVFVQQQRGPGKRREAAAALALQHLLSTGNIFSQARKCHCLIGSVWFNESGFLSQWEGGYLSGGIKAEALVDLTAHAGGELTGTADLCWVTPLLWVTSQALAVNAEQKNWLTKHTDVLMGRCHSPIAWTDHPWPAERKETHH